MVKEIKATIVYDTQRGGCEGKCGADWTATAVVSAVKESLTARFGDGVTLQLVDLAAPSQQAMILRQRVHREGLELPLLLLNEQLRISGEFDARQLMDMVETEGELG